MSYVQPIKVKGRPSSNPNTPRYSQDALDSRKKVSLTAEETLKRILKLKEKENNTGICKCVCVIL